MRYVDAIFFFGGGGKNGAMRFRLRCDCHPCCTH